MNNEELKASRSAWLEKTAATYTGDGINPEGKLAASNSKSKALALAARCWQCVGGNDDSKPVDRIRNCLISQCAIFPHRPYQEGSYTANLAARKDNAPTIPPNTVVSPIERALANPASRPLAIRAYCYDCMGGQPKGCANSNGNVRQFIGECRSTQCALWDVRPWQNATTDDDTENQAEAESTEG